MLSGAGAAILFALAALCGVASAWGFSVDDALISARVAHHLAEGMGYRFNVDGPIVDAVTPLGWAYLLALGAKQSTWQGLTVASIGGAAVWTLAAAWLGRACQQLCPGWFCAGLALALASCLPLGAWAVSGMETGLVMALGVGALGQSAFGAACVGLAAALRPELIPWALTLALGGAIARRESLSRCGLALSLGLGPALLVAVVRASVFGRPAPLAVFAKPSDLGHGLSYLFGLSLLSGLPYLLVAGRAWRSLSRSHVVLVTALAVHSLVLVGIGGDWMPFWRLGMPVLPGVLLLGAALAGQSSRIACAARLAGVLACAALLHSAKGADARGVRSQRARLIAAAQPLLAGAARIASVDIGWLGAAGEQHIVDLAGVTDEEVAYLPGGHTSKRLPNDFLERRDVDALVLLLASVPEPAGVRASGAPAADERLDALRAERSVEQRVLGLRGARRFSPVGRIALTAHQDYIVLRRQAAGGSPGVTP